VAERILQKVGVATRRAGGEEATVGANVQRSLIIALAGWQPVNASRAALQ
jgi:hypothetical protein